MSWDSPLKLRSDPGAKAARRHEALRGAMQTGRGHFCAVYAKPKSDTVLKLTVDKYQYALYTEFFRPQTPYFPRLVHDHGVIGKCMFKTDLPIYLVEMERLEGIGRSAPIVVKRESEALRRAVWNAVLPVTSKGCRRTNRDYACAKLEAASANECLSPGAREALKELANFASYFDEKLELDIHSANLMRRGSQLVINDPFSDSNYT